MTASNEKRELSTKSVVVASKDQVSSDLGGETILLGMESAMYFGLDDVGSRIWALIGEPRRVSDIRDTIAQEYEVDLDRCEADVLEFLRELISKGLAQITDGTEPAR